MARRGRGPATVVELRLLGPPVVAVKRGGRTVEAVFRLRRSMVVLAFLAVAASRRAPRETLEEALWPEAAGSSRRKFHPVVSLARSALREASGGDEAFVRQAGGIYALDEEIDWKVDVDLQRAAIEGGEAALAAGDRATAIARWNQAWKLYRGTLIEGTDAPWAADLRDRLRERHLGALRRLAETLSAEDRDGEALDAYRAILVEDPLQEAAHLALMGVYARQGRRDLVRRQYDRLCAVLREELGAEPLLRTTLEYHTLMA